MKSKKVEKILIFEATNFNIYHGFTQELKLNNWQLNTIKYSIFFNLEIELDKFKMIKILKFILDISYLIYNCLA